MDEVATGELPRRFCPERGLVPSAPPDRPRRRLALAAATLMGLSGALLAMSLVAHEARGIAAPQQVWLDRTVQGAFLSLSLLVLGVLGLGRLRSERVADVGSAYQLAGALLLALGSFAVEPALQATPSRLTWLGVWIVLFPLLAPAGPARTAILSIACAGLAPLALAAGTLARGAPWPEGAVFLWTCLPYPMCAVLALLPALVLERLSREVQAVRSAVTVLGQYELLERIGAGGMGEVWRARHQLLARPAAVKLVRPTIEGTSREEALARFEREARTTAQLRSPHTVSLYDYGVAADGTAYYAMELLEGLDLQALVVRYGVTPPGRAIRLVQQAAGSLAEAHAAGLVHRDVKPENLFLTRLGVSVDVLKVMDFGLVSLRTGPTGERARVSDPRLVVGTPAYMSPEQVLGGAPVDPRSDIYSLGCVLYWLLTGEPVFPGDSPLRVMIDHARRAPRPLRAWNPALAADLEAVVMSCLAKDPAARPHSALELLERLGECADAGRWTEAQARAWWAAFDRSRSGAISRPAASRSRERPTGSVTRLLGPTGR